MKKSCASCYFAKQCGTKKPCAYYTPIDKDHEDLVIQEEHEKNRKEFEKAWRLYEKRDGKA